MGLRRTEADLDESACLSTVPYTFASALFYMIGLILIMIFLPLKRFYHFMVLGSL